MSEEDVPGDGQARRRREEGCRREEAIRELLKRHGEKRLTVVDRRRDRVWGSAARLRDTSPLGRVWSEALAGEAIVDDRWFVTRRKRDRV